MTPRRAAKPRKTAKLKAGRKAGRGRLVPQPHGGVIWQNGCPNPTPGPGRPPSEIRAAMPGSLAERLEVAERIADDDAARDADRLAALSFLARFGLGTSDEVSAEEKPGTDVLMRLVREELLAELEALGPAEFTRKLLG